MGYQKQSITAPPQHQSLEPTIVNSDTISIGESGSLAVDKRFHTTTDGGKVQVVGYGTQLQRQQNRITGKESSNKFSGTLSSGSKSFIVKTDPKGNPTSMLTQFRADMKSAGTTSQATFHEYGQLASQVAFELQTRYGQPMTLDELHKITPAKRKEDEMRISFLTEW